LFAKVNEQQIDQQNRNDFANRKKMKKITPEKTEPLPGLA
jgi:hypothetical protein